MTCGIFHTMKILHILSQMPDFTGSGKYIQATITHAAKRGHENFLVAGVQGNFELVQGLIPEGNTRFVRFDGMDLDFLIPGMSDVMPYKSTVFSTLTADQAGQYEIVFKKVLSNAVDLFEPDMIHTHHLWLVSKVARTLFPDLPMVTTCHGTCLRQLSLCPDLGLGVQPSVRKIDRIMSLSQYQKNEIHRIHSIDPNRIDVVGGGYDDALFFHETKPEHGPVELVYAGKLSRAKGVPWLLKSLFPGVSTWQAAAAEGKRKSAWLWRNNSVKMF